MSWLQNNPYTLQAIWLTHHHADHSGGIDEIRRHYDVPVYAHHSSPCSQVTHRLNTDTAPPPFASDWLHTPGHTLCHIAFRLNDYLFTGDTLFSAGCGKHFEGDSTMLFNSLMQINQLPEQTIICPGHEYTLDNLKFAKKVEPNNLDIDFAIQAVTRNLSENTPSVPTTLAWERRINPFLRCHLKTVQAQVAKQTDAPVLNDADQTFKYLRLWKDNA